MKYWIIAFMGFVLFWSCEEDDICQGNDTPQMILKIAYQNEADSLRMDSLVIFRKNLTTDVFEGIYRSSFKKKDSLGVSLWLDDVPQTEFIISNRTYDTSYYDTLTVSYTRDLSYGSKACGYKINYFNVNYDVTSNFFIEKEALQTDITDETTAHLALYY